MGKKVKEYKSGDFIFAKVKGYPAWPARVQRMNGKKYFVYFYGTGETANLPPNMIFDYAENKAKFLSKSVKRRDFNDGVKQIEYDFANNVPLEDVIGVPMEIPADTTANDSAIDETLDDTAADTTAAMDTADDTVNTTQNDGTVEDSDEAGALVIDEGKQPATKGKKSKPEPKTPATPKGKEPKTPRGKAKKDETKEEDKVVDNEEKKDEELVSRSGRKIRPKRYIDEQTDENSTLPSPAPKKRRAASPDKEKSDKDKNIKHFNAVTQSELEDLKEPFKSEDPEKDNILITYLPTNQYVGIKLFTGRPNSFKSESSRLQWDKQAASNAVTLKMQLERGQITPQSIQAQLVMDLNLTDEEKATLDKERETEEKKSRVQFLKTEMKLIELDAKIKTCLCLEKADTEMCLKLLDELLQLKVKPLMLLKHPSCLETVKRMRAYVGNTPSWDLSENDALAFSKQAHNIRKQADTLYRNMKELFITPEGLSFWEYFSERVVQFKKATAKLSPNELLEMVHEPIELSQPSTMTMRSAIDSALEEDLPLHDEPVKSNKKTTPSKAKKPATPKGKRGKKQADEKTDKKDETDQNQEETEKNEEDDSVEKEKEVSNDNQQTEPTPDTNDVEMTEAEKQTNKEQDKQTKEQDKQAKDQHKQANEQDKQAKEQDKQAKEQDKQTKELEKQSDKETKEQNSQPETNSKEEVTNNKEIEETNNKNENVEGKPEESNGEKETSEKDKEEVKDGKDKEAKDKETKEKEKDKSDDKEKQEVEPRAKRSRESKKTEAPPPRSPAKRKSKF